PTANTKIDHLGEAEKLLANGRLDEADQMLGKAPNTTEQAGRRFGLRRRLTQEYDEKTKDAEAQLASIEIRLNNGQIDEARQQLETLVLPKFASEDLRARHRRLLEKAKASSTSALTHLRVGTPGFDGKDLPIGTASLPFHLPAGITQVAYGPTGVLTLRLPKEVKGGQGGVVALIAASEGGTARVTLLVADKRIPLPALHLESDTWTPVRVPLTGSDPANGIEFSVGESGRKSRLYGAGAVFHATRVATIADLGLTPGGLKALPIAFTNRDGPDDYIALTKKLAGTNSGFAKLDHLVIAAPAGSLVAASNLLTGLAKFLALPPPSTGDPRIVTFDSAESLEAAFDAAFIRHAHLLVVMVNTGRPPTKTTVSAQAKRCREAMAKGTLPVLMLSPQYEDNESLRRAWEDYVSALQRELPTLPIIDGGTASHFLRINNVSVSEADAQHLREDSVGAGFVELVTRLRAVLTISGVGQ
ncbi:MAG TPA: hypothetical protein VHX44_03815, partial [Planctomycetota bacterium]|nr:hypothetical protein [Planctomycetota bacterium]